ncbi:efflux RND transporter permease subunit, partial [Salmonella enterica subsp. enterica serovar Montevideo]|nr:efflux RND transporter permease subunit [Salmonella enterica subsp. enterica serovar Montevideo]
EMGYPSALTAKTWGFYDVSFKGETFRFQRPYGSYVMENVLFKCYVNDFIDRGRVKKVYVMSEAKYRMLPDDINDWYVRGSDGQMV